MRNPLGNVHKKARFLSNPRHYVRRHASTIRFNIELLQVTKSDTFMQNEENRNLHAILEPSCMVLDGWLVTHYAIGGTYESKEKMGSFGKYV